MEEECQGFFLLVAEAKITCSFRGRYAAPEEGLTSDGLRPTDKVQVQRLLIPNGVSMIFEGVNFERLGGMLNSAAEPLSS